MGRFYCRRIAFLIVLPLLLGCRSVRQAEPPAGAHFRVLTYNVNWGVPDPDTAIELIRHSNADIVCLQETTPEWAHLLRTALLPFAATALRLFFFDHWTRGSSFLATPGWRPESLWDSRMHSHGVSEITAR